MSERSLITRASADKTGHIFGFQATELEIRQLFSINRTSMFSASEGGASRRLEASAGALFRVGKDLTSGSTVDCARLDVPMRPLSHVLLINSARLEAMRAQLFVDFYAVYRLSYYSI